MEYIITYKGNKNAMWTLDNTITNDINRALKFGNKEDAEGWILEAGFLFQNDLTGLTVTKIN